jgi:hypothetical protein
LIPLRAKNLDTRHIPLPYNEYHTDVVDDRHAILRAVERIADLPISGLISNSYEDRDFARHIRADLQNKRVRCLPADHDVRFFFDRPPLPDTTAELLIDGFIKLGAKLLLVLSENSIGREWIEGNVSKALEEERKRGQIVLFPLLVNDAIMDTNADYGEALKSWNAALKPHLRNPDQPKVKIDVAYGDGKGQFDAYAQGFRSLRMLEAVAERSAETLAWPAGFTLDTQARGFINARWVQETRKLTLCYELAADFAGLYRDFGNVVAATSPKKKSKSK